MPRLIRKLLPAALLALAAVPQVPAATANSGLPGSAMPPITACFAGSITLALALRPLKVSTWCEALSYRIASGFWPVPVIVATVFNEARSNTVTDALLPSLTKPRCPSSAKAMPCTPAVPAIVPICLPASTSITSTRSPRLTNRWRLGASKAR